MAKFIYLLVLTGCVTSGTNLCPQSKPEYECEIVVTPTVVQWKF